jgi:DUF3060 family protein
MAEAASRNAISGGIQLWEHRCMESQDDPEARIQELERPLVDTAGASEAEATPTPGGGADPPDPPVPPSPSTYSDPFLETTPRLHSGNRVLWVLAAFFVFDLIALGGGISVYNAHRLSRGSDIASPTPNISPTNLAPSPASGPTPPPGGELSVSGINASHTIACNDGTVSVSGTSNTVVISGHCTTLTVSGTRNSVAVDAVDTIEASGFNNQVTYHTGSPRISKAGESNVVEQG